MTGHTKELHDPANTCGRLNCYPNAYYTDNPVGSEPSIRGRKIYVPFKYMVHISSKNGIPFSRITIQ